MKQVIVALCCAFSILASGCAITPVLKEGETAQIVKVIVTTDKEISGTANLPEAIRYKTQNAAYRFSERGAEKILKLHINGVQISNPGMALMVGGSSSISGKASLIDKISGKTDKDFDAVAIIPRLGGIIGAIAAADVDEVQEEQRLAGMLAEDVLMRIYGKEYAESVATRQPTKQITPNYPMSYNDARKKVKCEAIQYRNDEVKRKSQETGEESDVLEDLPQYCVAFLTKK